MRNISSYRLLWCFVLTMAMILIAGCSSVKFGYDDQADSPDKVGVAFSVSWPENFAPQDEMPEGVVVLMSRIINEVHYAWETLPDGRFVGESNAGSSYDNVGETVEGSEEENVDGTVREQVLVGDYYSIAYGFRQGTYDIVGLDEFRNYPANGTVANGNALTGRMMDLKASLPRLSTKEVEETFGSLPDFNPSQEFLSEASPLGWSVVKSTFLPGTATGDVFFDMQDRTVLLTFRLKVRPEAGVYVKRIVADVSGLPYEIGLMTGLVQEDRTGRMRFEMVQTSASESELVYETTVRTFGMFPAASSMLKSGNGIFRVTMTASNRGDDGSDDVEPLSRTRVFYAGVNLKKEIEAAKLLSETEDHRGYRIEKDQAIIEIGTVLKVGLNQIESVGDDSLTGWFENDDLDIEIGNGSST